MKVSQYTDGTFLTKVQTPLALRLGDMVHYGIDFEYGISGVSSYIESCSFGNDDMSRDIIKPNVSVYIHACITYAT